MNPTRIDRMTRLLERIRELTSAEVPHVDDRDEAYILAGELRENLEVLEQEIGNTLANDSARGWWGEGEYPTADVVYDARGGGASDYEWYGEGD